MNEDCHQSDHDLIVEFIAHAIVGSAITLLVLAFVMVINIKCCNRNIRISETQEIDLEVGNT